jgi:hypothetical protein
MLYTTAKHRLFFHKSTPTTTAKPINPTATSPAPNRPPEWAFAADLLVELGPDPVVLVLPGRGPLVTVAVTPIPVDARAEDRIDDIDDITSDDAEGVGEGVEVAVGGFRRPWPGFIKVERSTGGRVDCR